MQVLVNRAGLLAAWLHVAPVAPPRSPKPILQSLLLRCDADAGAHLYATDLEVGIAHAVLGVKVDRPGAVVLPAERFGAILRSSTDEELGIAVVGDCVEVRGLDSEFTLTTEDPTHYPDVSDCAAATSFTVGAADLKRLIRRTIYATDPASTRYALGGVLFAPDAAAGTLVAVATDGRRLARQVVSVACEGAPTWPASAVVPLKALKLVDRCLGDDDPPVQIACDLNRFTVRTERAVITSRLVEGRFPKHEDVFPTTPGPPVAFLAGVLRRKVEQAVILTSEETRGVDFRFGEGVLRLSSQTADKGKSRITLPVPYEGPAVDLTLDPRYLLDALKPIADAASFTWELRGAMEPVLARTDDGLTIVVMPLTREK